MQKRYKLSGHTLEDIRAKAAQQYGPGARIVAAEKITNPGIVGLFAAARFEATIEVAEAKAAPETPAAPVHQLHGPAIMALLESADAAEREFHQPTPARDSAAAAVSTASPDFAGLLEQLGKEFTPAPEVPAPKVPAPKVHAEAPAPLRPVPQAMTGEGNLIVLLGLGDDALGTALDMSLAWGGSDVRTAGDLSAFGHLHVSTRQSATAARAQAVLTGQTVLVALGLGRARDAVAKADLIAALAPDQVWIVADARQKPDDTKTWVEALRASLAAGAMTVDALAVRGASETATPETVNGLGIPVGWVDGRAATASAVGKVH